MPNPLSIPEYWHFFFQKILNVYNMYAYMHLCTYVYTYINE
jgi:hypothetical protein